MTISRHWLDSYPTGVPADIDPLHIRSVAHLAEESFTRFADRVAFVQMGRNITYRDLDTQTRAFGAWLQQHTGLKRGGRVAIMMPNLLQYPIALFGVLRAGGTVVNTNPLYTARELEHQLKDSGAETVVILENFAHVLQEVIGRTQVKHVVVTSVGELLGFPKGAIVDFVVRTVRKQVPAWSLPGHHRFLDVLAIGARHALQQIELGHDDLAFLQYTGGTTGVSKGAMLSHGNIAANVLQSTAWTEPAWPKDQTGIAITALPLYHIFALTGNCILFLRIGWTNVLITNPRDFPGFVKELAKHKFTFISGVNTLFNALLHTPGFEKVDFSALRCTLGGGMAVQRAVADRWKQVTGCILTQAWGLTETSPVTNVCLSTDHRLHSVGRPVPWLEQRIVDPATGLPVETGHDGEVQMKGPNVTQGYFRLPAETAAAFTHDGYFRTGDIGRFDDDGFLYITGRLKEMLIIGGENVFPREIEEVLGQHPAVAACGVIGCPDPIRGELPVAFVEVREGVAAGESDLIAWCRGRLAVYKVPRDIRVVAELPKNPTGKVVRRELRKWL